MNPQNPQPPRRPQSPGVISDFVPGTVNLPRPRPPVTPAAPVADNRVNDILPTPVNPTPQLARQPQPLSPRPVVGALPQSPPAQPTQPPNKPPVIGQAVSPLEQHITPASGQFGSFANVEPQAISPGITDRVAKPNQGFRDILSIFGVLASALLLAFCLITFVFQSYQVDGPSMQTTLENNDHLIVWKVPKTVAKLTGSHFIPHRGDVIVFNESGTGAADKQLIKRVIGLPGERVVVRDNSVTVYNKEFPNGFSPDKTLPYGSVIKFTPGNGDWSIKEGEIFVMGDHRDNSLDSRHFGPIESEQIIGKLVLRVLPLNQVTKF